MQAMESGLSRCEERHGHSGTVRVPEERSEVTEDKMDPRNPMVCAPIRPFIVQVTLKHPKMGKAEHIGALVDTGCMRCPLRRSVAEGLGLCIITLQTPIKFEQMEGSTLGGQPATHVTELARLERSGCLCI